MVTRIHPDIPPICSSKHRLLASTSKEAPDISEALTGFKFIDIDTFQDYLKSIYYLAPDQRLPTRGVATAFNLFICGEYIFKFKEPHDKESVSIIVWKDESFVSNTQLEKRDRLVSWHKFICQEIMSKYPKMRFKDAVEYYEQNKMEFSKYIPPVTEELKEAIKDSPKIQELEKEQKLYGSRTKIGFRASNQIEELIRNKAKQENKSLANFIYDAVLIYLQLPLDKSIAEEQAKEILLQEQKKEDRKKQLLLQKEEIERQLAKLQS